MKLLFQHKDNYNFIIVSGISNKLDQNKILGFTESQFLEIDIPAYLGYIDVNMNIEAPDSVIMALGGTDFFDIIQTKTFKEWQKKFKKYYNQVFKFNRYYHNVNKNLLADLTNSNINDPKIWKMFQMVE